MKNEIINVAAAHPVFIYVGVGAASATLGKAPLSLDHYQQFPPFLQELRNTIPHLHMFLLLLDPYQENPPQVAVDYDLRAKQTDQYSSTDGTLQAFVFRQAVYTDADTQHPEKASNITETLRDLNRFVKEQRASLVYHDFSGRKTGLLAEYFDRENLDHLDQIVYSLSARTDHGCYLDLMQAHAFFPFRLEPSAERPQVKLFNYYKYIANNSYADVSMEIQAFPPEMRPLMKVQRNQIIQNIRDQFKNTNLSLLRQAHAELIPKQAQQPEQQEQPAMQDYSFNQLPHLYRQMFIELFKEKEYSLLYDLLFNYSASELDVLAKLKEMEMSGEELLTFITMDEDPYKWYNALNSLL